MAAARATCRRGATARREAARTLPKPATPRNARKCRCIGFSAPAGVDCRVHLRQRPGTRSEPRFAVHLSHVPLHLEAGEPFHVARQVDVRSHALPLVGGGIGRPVLDDPITRLLLGIEARIDVLLRRRAAHQADHCAGGSLAGFLNIDAGKFLATSRVERGGALARLGDVRAGAKLLNVVAESGGGAGALRLGPSLLVLLLAGLLVEGGDALACLGTVGAGRKLLNVVVKRRGGAGALRVSPGLLVRVFSGLLVEGGKALSRLRNVRAGAEVLCVRGERRGGAGANGIGPGLVVRLPAAQLGHALARLRHVRTAAEILDIPHICRGST